MPATLAQLIELRSQRVEELLAYLDNVARLCAQVPAYYPEELQSVELGETRFDHIRQVVQVVNRKAFEDYLRAQNEARQREQQRTAGYPDERQAYKPGRARREGGSWNSMRPSPVCRCLTTSLACQTPPGRHGT